MEKLEGEDNKYVVYYKILDADHNGRSPKDRNFDKSHKSCLQKIAKSGNKVRETTKLCTFLFWRDPAVNMCLYIYTYICTYVHMYIRIYIHMCVLYVLNAKLFYSSYTHGYPLL